MFEDVNASDRLDTVREMTVAIAKLAPDIDHWLVTESVPTEAQTIAARATLKHALELRSALFAVEHNAQRLIEAHDARKVELMNGIFG